MSDSNVAHSARGDTVRSSRPSSSRSGSLPKEARKSGSKSTPERSPSPPPPKIDTISNAISSRNGSLLAPPSLSFTAPTPEASPISPSKRVHHKSTPTQPTSVLKNPTPLTPPPVQKAFSSNSGKRKASEAEVDANTPPKENREPRATFAPEPRAHRASATSSSSHAPISYHRTKRARISLTSDPQPPRSIYASMTSDSPNAKSTGSWSSRASRASTSPVSHGPQPYSSRPPSTRDNSANGNQHHPRRSASRRSISNASIPISAFMSPHAPSITPSSTFHMRDPRKPPRLQDTPWTLSFPVEVEAGEGRWSINGWVDRGGSPLHAWFFFAGFVLFPVWWISGFLVPIPRTRRLAGEDSEKGVILDDPQVEHDHRSWRRRCRILSVVSLFTYIPFIVLVAIFA
ncbi:hypothetical protein FA15DRAFT_146788 [Coprinopsis marcescibilis]|uniref:Uncharacterized protein n=1 Tax=Coprinopsis marcescibilis TaxID=230819 RepID=A0A5C3L4K2_COPMA|nr:hypothetical protein FA15DRAFT_146788 [Coprinopsis marcescibilis]